MSIEISRENVYILLKIRENCEGFLPRNFWHLWYMIHTYIHTYIRTYVHTYIHTYIRTYIHTYIHTYRQTYIHTKLLIHTQNQSKAKSLAANGRSHLPWKPWGYLCAP